MSKLIKRTCMCGEVSSEMLGKEVALNGWVAKQRSLGSLIFVDLRDRTGIVQVVFDDSIPEDLLIKAEGLRSEFAIGVKGLVRERSSKNPDLPTGDLEVIASELIVYSTADTPPIYVKDDDNVDENLRLKYRYLDLRKLRMQRNLRLRHEVSAITRDYFYGQGFLDVETPVLIKPTPEGARDFLVPSRLNPGHFYALPQSPQLFKQLLMVSGCDRYIQIAKCFRDEDLRADRQPEFTQIDLEMSFVDADDVMTVNEGFIKRLFRELLGVEVSTPLLRMPYSEAMDRFGSDKPDMRFGFELKNLTDIAKDCGFGVFEKAVEAGGSVRAINVKGYADKFTRKDIDSLGEFVKTYRAKGLAWMKVGENMQVQSPIAKFLSEDKLAAVLERTEAGPGDIIFFAADADQIVFDSLGALRCECASRLNILRPDDYKFLWVVDFPLFEYSEEENRYVAKHHPFTSPKDEDMDIVETDKARARAKAYDIVLNGTEVGGGSIRIHSQQLQERMFRALGFTMEEAWARFGFLLDAFRYGPPPHGGMAYGLDRLVMLMSGSESIRDVIAFPKVQNASELMSGAPDVVDEKQLRELGLAVTDREGPDGNKG